MENILAFIVFVFICLFILFWLCSSVWSWVFVGREKIASKAATQRQLMEKVKSIVGNDISAPDNKHTHFLSIEFETAWAALIVLHCRYGVICANLSPENGYIYASEIRPKWNGDYITDGPWEHHLKNLKDVISIAVENWDSPPTFKGIAMQIRFKEGQEANDYIIPLPASMRSTVDDLIRAFHDRRHAQII